jgi:GTP pyrophosphokinase
MVSAAVHGKKVRYSHVLCTGDVIEIHTSEDAPGPDRSWLGYAKTNGAKTKIQTWLKRERCEENIASGRAYVESVLKREGYQLNDRAVVILSALAVKNRFNMLDDFYAAIGYGGVSTANASKWITDELRGEAFSGDSGDDFANGLSPAASRKRKPFTGVSVLSEEHDSAPVKLANCCSPLPGDEIVGFVTRSDGVSIHKKECYNIEVRSKLAANDSSAITERVVDAAWTGDTDDVYNATLEVIAFDRKCLLADVITCVANSELLIVANTSRLLKDGNAAISFTVEITGVEQLSGLISKLAQIEGVINVGRGTNS